MEILNQLLSNQADYLNALRNAQQIPVAPPPDPGNGPKFNFNGKLIARILMAAGILYVGYQIYRSHTREPLDEEE
jgi:hypothetical protein